MSNLGKVFSSSFTLAVFGAIVSSFKTGVLKSLPVEVSVPVAVVSALMLSVLLVRILSLPGKNRASDRASDRASVRESVDFLKRSKLGNRSKYYEMVDVVAGEFSQAVADYRYREGKDPTYLLVHDSWLVQAAPFLVATGLLREVVPSPEKAGQGEVVAKYVGTIPVMRSSYPFSPVEAKDGKVPDPPHSLSHGVRK